MADTTGLKAILNHNETAQPNDDLLNTLKADFPQFFDKDGNFKADKFEDELKKSNITEARDGYKLGFVGKDYARLQVGLKSETMIVPDCKHNVLPENANSGNVFITGDNLDALRHLVNAYENKIKLIYIDPPYNTGKEFIYSDKFEFSDEKLKSILGYTDEEIARLKSIQGKSSHSAWLTFMYPRLKIAQRLLKDDGVIFVSIDDNEQANLKLIMDDVFGESNFVAELIWSNKEGGGGSDSTHFKVKHEYIFCYARNKYLFSINGEICIEDSSYNCEDSFVEERGKYKLIKLNSFSIQYSTSLDYPITLPDGKTIFPSEDGKKGCWRWSREKYDWGKKEGFIEFKNNQDGKLWVYTKQYFKVDNENKPIIRTLPPDALIEKYSSTMATKQLETLFERDSIFNYSKPSPLLHELIYKGTQKDSLILDFFAGSATTAHAVLQLNAEDGGNRKFIMVQLDEKTNPDSEARKAGYNTIDEIARDRICRAGKKILADYESDLVRQTNGWDKDIGFKHYRLITPDVKTLEKIVGFDPKESNLIADDMIKPFEYKKTETGGLDTILTTWLIDDGYRFDTPVEEIIFGNYKAYYVRDAITLYLINMGWDTNALKDMLNQIGKNKLLVKTIVVYPYSFEFEAMRELKTNIKTNLDSQPNLIERF